MRIFDRLIVAIALVIVAITQVAAFVPDYPRAAFTSGDPHITITQKALDEIYATHD
jgi:HAMP domain-containing protein